MTLTVAGARERLARAEAALAAATPADSGDPATARLGRTALRQHHRTTDRDLARYTAALVEVQAAEWAVTLAEGRQREADRPRLTAEDVAGAKLVRDRNGWHVVVRASAKSVTVETGYSWTDRIPLDRILKVVR